MKAQIILRKYIEDYEEEDCLAEINVDDYPLEAIKIIAKVLTDNKHKYPVGHWKTIKFDEHMRHAGAHYICAWEGCDDDEPHLAHCLTRLAMAAELEKEAQ